MLLLLSLLLLVVILNETDEVVFSQFSFAGEESGTDGALIRVLSRFFHFCRVILLMSFQIGELGKRAITAGEIALVRSLARVFAHVLLQVRLLFESFLAVRALVFPLVRVHQLVLIEISFAGKGFGTFGAREQLLRGRTVNLACDFFVCAREQRESVGVFVCKYRIEMGEEEK